MIAKIFLEDSETMSVKCSNYSGRMNVASVLPQHPNVNTKVNKNGIFRPEGRVRTFISQNISIRSILRSMSEFLTTA